MLSRQTWTRHHAERALNLTDPEDLVAFPFCLDPGRLAPLLVRDAGMSRDATKAVLLFAVVGASPFLLQPR